MDVLFFAIIIPLCLIK